MRAEIQELCTALLAGLKDVLGARLHGVYLFGALTFPDGGAITDIEFQPQIARLHTPYVTP